MCLYPKFIKNPKYLPNKKNHHNPPKAKDSRVMYVPIACGKCMECKKAKAREWQVRLSEEIKHNRNGLFVTLTFNDESLSRYMQDTDDENIAAKKAVRHFLERWRKKYGKSLKHWLVTEKGEDYDRIHLHGFLFTDQTEDVKKIWGNGFVYIGEYVNQRTVNYCVKYVQKQDEKHKDFQQIILTSPGIGRDYTKTMDFKKNTFKDLETNEMYKLPTGHKIPLPIYYRNKAYSESEREKLWLQKLDKKKRYVLGTEIDISTDKGLRRYKRVLKQAQEKNIQHGYKDCSNEWNELKYSDFLKIVNKIHEKTC